MYKFLAFWKLWPKSWGETNTLLAPNLNVEGTSLPRSLQLLHLWLQQLTSHTRQIATSPIATFESVARVRHFQSVPRMNWAGSRRSLGSTLGTPHSRWMPRLPQSSPLCSVHYNKSAKPTIIMKNSVPQICENRFNFHLCFEDHTLCYNMDFQTKRLRVIKKTKIQYLWHFDNFQVQPMYKK